MEALQNMILIGVLLVRRHLLASYKQLTVKQNNKDRSEAAWALLGAGIKVRVLLLRVGWRADSS
jgi:hypothetical protein